MAAAAGAISLLAERIFLTSRISIRHAGGFCQSPGRSSKLHNELIPLGTLGHGACAKVYKVVHVPSLQILAQKVVPIFDEKKRKQVVQELRVLYGSCFVRRHIVNFHDAFVDPREGSISVLMEYMDGGSLQDIVESGGCPHETVLANIAWRVLNGLVYLHNICNQIHRDIKPANLLINHRGDVKISDFGISRNCDSNYAQHVGYDRANATTFVGTITYMSPERLLGESYDFKADIWSLGVTLVTCALGRFPYAMVPGLGFWGLLQMLREGPPPKLPACTFSRIARDFVRQCVHRAPGLRPSASDLLSHPFIVQYKCISAKRKTDGVAASPIATQFELKKIVAIADSHYAAGSPASELAPDARCLARLAYQLGAPCAIVRYGFRARLSKISTTRVCQHHT